MRPLSRINVATMPPNKQIEHLSVNTENEEYNVRNEGSRSLTYMPWHEHVKGLFLSQWKLFFIVWVGLLGIFWGLIEAFSFFFSALNLSNIIVLSFALIIGLAASLTALSFIEPQLPEAWKMSFRKSTKLHSQRNISGSMRLLMS